MALSKFLANMIYEPDLDVAYVKHQPRDMLEGEEEKQVLHQ